ncbi:hypothetical protein QZH41_001832 [Actinostola sp. cb2023]|nr:hypothetical protein QZH41_001832 [Actinostola sp. cb2023]
MSDEPNDQITKEPETPIVKQKDPKRVAAGKKLAEYHRTAKKALENSETPSAEPPNDWAPSFTTVLTLVGISLTALDLYLRWKKEIPVKTTVYEVKTAIEPPKTVVRRVDEYGQTAISLKRQRAKRYYLNKDGSWSEKLPDAILNNLGRSAAADVEYDNAKEKLDGLFPENNISREKGFDLRETEGRIEVTHGTLKKWRTLFTKKGEFYKDTPAIIKNNLGRSAKEILEANDSKGAAIASKVESLSDKKVSESIKIVTIEAEAALRERIKALEGYLLEAGNENATLLDEAKEKDSKLNQLKLEVLERTTALEGDLRKTEQDNSKLLSEAKEVTIKLKKLSLEASSTTAARDALSSEKVELTRQLSESQHLIQDMESRIDDDAFVISHNEGLLKDIYHDLETMVDGDTVRKIISNFEAQIKELSNKEEVRALTRIIETYKKNMNTLEEAAHSDRGAFINERENFKDEIKMEIARRIESEKALHKQLSGGAQARKELINKLENERARSDDIEQQIADLNRELVERRGDLIMQEQGIRDLVGTLRETESALDEALNSDDKLKIRELEEEKTRLRFHAYRGGINFDWGGVAYDVFKKEIGGPVHHYDGLVEHALTKALGKRIHNGPLGNDDAPVHTHFPKELEMVKTSYPVVSTPFDKTPPSFDPEEIDIYVKPSQKFTIKPRNIFTGVLKHVTQKEAHK